MNPSFIVAPENIAMTRHLLLLLVGLGLALTVQAHGEHAARHGGRLLEAGPYWLEWVAPENAFYLTDHDGNEVATAGADGKVIAVGAGAKTTVTLTPAGGNRLTLSGPLPMGAETKAVISITLPGRPPAQGRLDAP